MPRIQSRYIVVAVFTILAVSVIGVLVAGSTTQGCVSCHSMTPFSAEARSAHASIGCYDCHLPTGWWDWPGFKARELLGMYPKALTGRGLSGPGSSGLSRPCLGCHEQLLQTVTEKDGLRIRHETCRPLGGDCSSCHSSAIHPGAARWVRQPVMEECVLCHREQKVSSECDLCHSGRSENERLAQGPWQVTHGRRWRETHGMGDLEYCSTCHPDDYCVDCHGLPMPHTVDFGRIHGQLSAEDGIDCAQCHPSQAFCDDCHGLEMPHPAGFLPEHSSLAESREDTTCLGCHPADACFKCHQKHTHPGATEGSLGEVAAP